MSGPSCGPRVAGRPAGPRLPSVVLWLAHGPPRRPGYRPRQALLLLGEETRPPHPALGPAGLWIPELSAAAGHCQEAEGAEIATQRGFLCPHGREAGAREGRGAGGWARGPPVHSGTLSLAVLWLEDLPLAWAVTRGQAPAACKAATPGTD